MVDKDSAQHSSMYSRGICYKLYKPALAFNTHNDIMYLYLCN